jgi:hypothetical protein
MTLRYPKKLVKYRPHRPPQSDRGRKTRKTLHSYAVDKRAVFVIAVDTLLSADDSRIEYRPQESPAKRHIMGGAVDAGGTLRCSSGQTSAIAFSAVQPHRLEVLKAASNAFVAEGQALGDVGPDRVLRGFKTACIHIESRRPALW